MVRRRGYGERHGANSAFQPVTITLSPEQVANLCEKRLPRIETADHEAAGTDQR